MEKDLKKEINNALYVLGVPTHLKGFEYLSCAIYEILEGSLSCRKLTGQGGVYEYVGLVFDATWKKVERCIRQAKGVSLKNMSAAFKKDIFGNTITADTQQVTNKHYISTIVNVLKYEPEKLRRG